MHRPVDLARLHGLSVQAIRNYERDGVIPAARRTASGYRVYTDLHVGALGAYLALVRGYGYRTAGVVMRAVDRDDPESAYAAIDAAHVQLQRDRETLATVASAATVLAAASPSEPGDRPLPVGAVAHRLAVTPATLRKWERAGILVPRRDRFHHRVYSPDDVRDAELAHLLRRGGYRLDHIAAVLHQVRDAGGPEPLAGSLAGWQERLTARGRAMLTGSARLADYLDLRDPF
ncbi:TioE family transcriptional regulator [Actinoplanes aureus]|uniref:TioE family transcriptional regulator n=1 Tax=Actinoplanes aureus TaxID=2792083 RepID=A0A931FUZ1_9ACTN|nr:TioE family transcriptional regulator [Actinoplanes aureus]MBG0560277.1 TioE family transcriptional regulator [Actinoplanes aureus]